MPKPISVGASCLPIPSLSFVDMRYRHMKTGVIIDVPSEMSGAWVRVEENSTLPQVEKKPAKTATKRGAKAK